VIIRSPRDHHRRMPLVAAGWPLFGAVVAVWAVRQARGSS
jgi:hypothetical protein